MGTKVLAASLVGALVLVGGLPMGARSEDQERPDHHGQGMGSGMAGDNGGYAMGPGMMGDDGDYAMAPGMMGGQGGYGMGPDMMGGEAGFGMGPGMMRGYGMGPIWMLALSDSQRAEINTFADQLRKKHWALMGKIMDEQTKLRDLVSASEPDPKAVGAAYAAISKLRQEMLEAHVQATNQARAVLTKEQREQYDNWRREGRGFRPGHRGMGTGMAAPR